jgi:hypothetical protein
MKFVGLLDHLVYFVDHIGKSHYIVHFVLGVFFGFFFGMIRPQVAFWAATGLGFGKETIDYLKHAYESASFRFLTDGKYGLHDGLQDLLLWMVGGYVAYRIWRRSHRIIKARHARVMAADIDVNAANIVIRPGPMSHLSPQLATVDLKNCVHLTRKTTHHLL